MEQIYHFYEGKANNLMRVCGVLKSFSTFILLCKMKLGCTSKILKTYFGISLMAKQNNLPQQKMQ